VSRFSRHDGRRDRDTEQGADDLEDILELPPTSTRRGKCCEGPSAETSTCSVSELVPLMDRR
jgi:hypothetical protein